MAGQKPDNVVWFDWKSKGFTTSTYYKKPTWIQSINQSVPFNAYVNQNWEAEIPSPFAVEDNSIYEQPFPGEISHFRIVYQILKIKIMQKHSLALLMA